MSTQNTSDMIEAYLRALLDEAAEVEIQRAALADRFDVVPSQINYVIKTRFNESKGYDVESKRGGGGYIKIVRFHYSGKHDLLDGVYGKLGETLSVEDATDVLQFLFDEKIMSRREANLLLTPLASPMLGDALRSALMKEILQRLDKENDI